MPEEIDPYRTLALGVLHRAIADALGVQNRGAEWMMNRETLMAEALDWIQNDEAMLPFWCDVAGVQPEAYRKAALKRIEEGSVPFVAFS